MTIDFKPPVQYTYILVDSYYGTVRSTQDSDVVHYYIDTEEVDAIRLPDMHAWDHTAQAWTPIAGVTAADIPSPDAEDDGDEF